MDWEGLIVVYVICLWFWFIGLASHKKCAPLNRDTLHFPRWLAFFFGRYRNSNSISWRGIIAQLSAYGVAIIFTLDLGGFISRNDAVIIFGWSGGLLSLLAVFFAIKYR